MVKTPGCGAGNPISRGRTHRNTESIRSIPIGIVVTTDGSFGELPRDNFPEAEEDYSGTEKTAETIYRAGKFAECHIKMRL